MICDRARAATVRILPKKLTLTFMEGEVLEKRQLGRHCLKVSAIGLGCMRLSAGHGPVRGTKEEMIAVLRGAVDRGIIFFDTAQVYGPFVKRRAFGRSARSCARTGLNLDEIWISVRHDW
jgi:predicted oxidoreductase